MKASRGFDTDWISGSRQNEGRAEARAQGSEFRVQGLGFRV